MAKKSLFENSSASILALKSALCLENFYTIFSKIGNDKQAKI